jgi:hypothetical protein
MCAIDALGILLVADCDGVILSEDAAGGAVVRVERANRRWAFTPSTTVVLAASISQSGPSSSCSCPHINFHTNAGGAEAYLQTHPDVRGSIFDQPTALETAARIFGSMLA